MVALSLLSLLLAPAVLASPWRRDGEFQGACVDPPSAFNIPQSFDALSSSPNLALLGVGVQNYKCENGAYTSVGAVADLFDISCLYGQGGFNTIQNDALKLWEDIPDLDPVDGVLALAMLSLGVFEIGEHYFVNKDSALVPVWDCTSSFNNPNAIVYAQKKNSSPSPDPTHNVAWLELVGESGGLANRIYRIGTVGGQPQTTCNPNENVSVKYSAIYVLV